jgi:cytochrome c
MKKRQFLMGIAATVFAMSFGTSAALAGEKDDAKAMVEAAAKAVTANKEDGLKQIQAGKFVKGEVYAFAYDLTATMLAHPKNPKLVGQNLAEKPDVEGKLFRKEIVEKAKSAGTGWVDYVYKNPETNAVENKTTYLKRAGDVVICAGAYQ